MSADPFHNHRSGLVCNLSDKAVIVSLHIEDNEIVSKKARRRVPGLYVERSFPRRAGAFR